LRKTKRYSKQHYWGHSEVGWRQFQRNRSVSGSGNDKAVTIYYAIFFTVVGLFFIGYPTYVFLTLPRKKKLV
jgi:hypothetical protein